MDKITLDTKEAASYANLSPGTLNNWRCTKQVIIPYLKLGRKVVYLQDDLDKFLASKRIIS